MRWLGVLAPQLPGLSEQAYRSTGKPLRHASELRSAIGALDIVRRSSGIPAEQQMTATHGLDHYLAEALMGGGHDPDRSAGDGAYGAKAERSARWPFAHPTRDMGHLSRGLLRIPRTWADVAGLFEVRLTRYR